MIGPTPESVSEKSCPLPKCRKEAATRRSVGTRSFPDLRRFLLCRCGIASAMWQSSLNNPHGTCRKANTYRREKGK